MPEKELISIGEASEIMGISIDTLRRWDSSGKLPSIKSSGGHRLYNKDRLEIFLKDIIGLAKDWVFNNSEISGQFHCTNSAVFQARLIKFQDLLANDETVKNIFPLIVAITGEIGNNSFDHNLGNWPDTPGIFFSYDVSKKIVVLADRGQGILTTLKRVKPSLTTHEDALRVAYTEILSGRSPESRGNGLKFVRKIVTENPIGLTFLTGNAILFLERENSTLIIKRVPTDFRGCLAVITY
ncbi:MAG TPA: helix-turn-helix domain-containing protein [Candidatus Paceibacterota bacterium]